VIPEMRVKSSVFGVQCSDWNIQPGRWHGNARSLTSEL
jgi:hypothetical protein